MEPNASAPIAARNFTISTRCPWNARSARPVSFPKAVLLPSKEALPEPKEVVAKPAAAPAEDADKEDHRDDVEVISLDEVDE